MNKTLTLRLPGDLSDWLAEESARTGLSRGRIVRQQLETARKAVPEKGYLKLAGTISGPKGLSQRRGFSTK